jgi:hypothetical protein
VGYKREEPRVSPYTTYYNTEIFHFLESQMAVSHLTHPLALPQANSDRSSELETYSQIKDEVVAFDRKREEGRKQREDTCIAIEPGQRQGPLGSVPEASGGGD